MAFKRSSLRAPPVFIKLQLQWITIIFCKLIRLNIYESLQRNKLIIWLQHLSDSRFQSPPPHHLSPLRRLFTSVLCGHCVQNNEELNRQERKYLSPSWVLDIFSVRGTSPVCFLQRATCFPFLLRQAVCELSRGINGCFRLVVKDSSWKYFCDYQ